MRFHATVLVCVVIAIIGVGTEAKKRKALHRRKRLQAVSTLHSVRRHCVCKWRRSLRGEKGQGRGYRMLSEVGKYTLNIYHLFVVSRILVCHQGWVSASGYTWPRINQERVFRFPPRRDFAHTCITRGQTGAFSSFFHVRHTLKENSQVLSEPQNSFKAHIWVVHKSYITMHVSEQSWVHSSDECNHRIYEVAVPNSTSIPRFEFVP